MGSAEGSLPNIRMSAAFQSNPERYSQDGISREVSPRVEEKHTWEVVPMTPFHLPGVVNLFRGYDKPVETPDGTLERDSLHVHHENLTLFTPANWKDEAAVSRFAEVAKEFYFPDQPFTVIAPKTEKPVEVMRASWVALRDEEIVGVYSALSDDPYAPATDRQRADPEKNEHPLTMAYGHVLMVKRSARRMEVGSYLIAKANDKLLGEAGYDQVTACVDQAGSWSSNVDFLHAVGFDDDFRKSGAYSYLDAEGHKVFGRRLITTAEGWRKKRDEVYRKIGSKWNIKPEDLASA